VTFKNTFIHMQDEVADSSPVRCASAPAVVCASHQAALPASSTTEKAGGLSDRDGGIAQEDGQSSRGRGWVERDESTAKQVTDGLRERHIAKEPRCRNAEEQSSVSETLEEKLVTFCWKPNAEEQSKLGTFCWKPNRWRNGDNSLKEARAKHRPQKVEARAQAEETGRVQSSRAAARAERPSTPPAQQVSSTGLPCLSQIDVDMERILETGSHQVDTSIPKRWICVLCNQTSQPRMHMQLVAWLQSPCTPGPPAWMHSTHEYVRDAGQIRCRKCGGLANGMRSTPRLKKKCNGQYISDIQSRH